MGQKIDLFYHLFDTQITDIDNRKMTDIGPINSKSNNCFILNHNASAWLFCSKKEMSQLETRTLNRFFFFSVLASPLKFEDKPENPVQQSEVLCEGYNVKYCVTEMLISLLLVMWWKFLSIKE